MLERKYQPIDPKTIKYCCEGDVYYLHRDDQWLRVRIKYDEAADSPRKWNSNLGTIISCVGNWDISDFNHSFTNDQMRMWETETADDPNVYRLPIYMYEHSGQTISLSPFRDRWDSGQCGWIYCTKEEALEWGFKEETWQDQAKAEFESEIEIYDAYIRGETYYYILEEPQMVSHTNQSTGKTWETEIWVILESLGGFYGHNPNTNGMFDEILHKDEILYEEVKE